MEQSVEAVIDEEEQAERDRREEAQLTPSRARMQWDEQHEA